MTDPNPPPSPSLAVDRHSLSLDETIEYCIGPFGWKQLLQSTILSLAWFFDSQQTFISVFTDAIPKWSCKNPTCNSTTTTNMCHLPKDSWSWDSPARSSIISEWSLECAGPIITGLPASSFFSGCLVGGFVLATLADSSVGRKKLLVLSSLLMSIAGVLTPVSNNVWIYAGLRFISGFGRANMGTCAFVHATELVGKKWRERVGIFGFVYFTLGFLSLPIIAFLLRGCSWRLMYLCTCVPCVLYSILVYFSVHESPRWLFIKGRKEEFKRTLTSLASRERRSTLTERFFMNSVEWGEISQERNIFSALKILIKKSWALRRLAVVIAVGFGIGMIYYGTPSGLGNLSFNLYFSVAMNALSELPSTFIAFILIRKSNRKVSVIGLTLLSGICSGMSAFERLKTVKMVLELVSFCSGCAAFDVLLMYALELFPTCVRNSAVTMAREAALLGGVLGPVLVAIGRRNDVLAYGVFGVTMSLCGFFVVWLPETKGRVLRDTMEEEEGKDGKVDEYSA
ncbi:Synaptic vesicle transporter SVOP and related transporters (major facilitator superfamily) [Handroanthus impetiginosus]|uniref:Synaptic vesicle transporter SVOP and related transporters (Major facilitator superfamily) n=1 Tax=Handroanthus impetiginosus TaxID=429701 RepID=A0A2G9GY48_9LAMI|nr:Synaptic vesicle transporter SVOP and related transporters (major facilitator superfamily) [Handroanthus impetiginosus]